MPFIDAKITTPLTDTQKETLKSRFGTAISAMNKGESFLMVGIEDDYDLWFGGNKPDKGAMVQIQVFGPVDPENAEAMTVQVCDLLEEELGIPADKVYVNYTGFTDWGWNRKNF